MTELDESKLAVIGVIESETQADTEELLHELNDRLIREYAKQNYELLPKFIKLGLEEYTALQINVSAKMQENMQEIAQASMIRAMRPLANFV